VLAQLLRNYYKIFLSATRRSTFKSKNRPFHRSAAHLGSCKLGENLDFPLSDPSNVLMTQQVAQLLNPTQLIVVSLPIKHTHSPYFTLYRYRRRKNSKRLSPLVTFNLEIPPDKNRTTVPSKEQPRRNIFISCKSRRTSRFEICNGKSIEFNKLIGALYGFTNLSGNCGKY
jgi:hypothetical protein